MYHHNNPNNTLQDTSHPSNENLSNQLPIIPPATPSAEPQSIHWAGHKRNAHLERTSSRCSRVLWAPLCREKSISLNGSYFEWSWMEWGRRFPVESPKSRCASSLSHVPIGVMLGGPSTVNRLASASSCDSVTKCHPFNSFFHCCSSFMYFCHMGELSKYAWWWWV